MIAVCSCQCGSSDSLIRNFLKSAGYDNWLNIPIDQGKERSLALLNYLPPTPEKDMLYSFIKGASKWAVIIGYTDTEMRWSNIASNDAKSRVEASLIVETFSNLS